MMREKSIGRVWVWTLAFLAASAAGGARAYADDPDSLLLEIHVEEGAAAEDQPIQVVICVTNVGRQTFEDLAPLEPSGQSMQLKLLREGRQGYIPMGGVRATVIVGSPGPSLRPGDSACEVISLLDWFGGFPGEGHEMSWAIGQMTLKPGRYELRAEYHARLGQFAGLPPYTVSSSTVPFEIRPRSSFPKDDQLLGRFLSDGAFDRSDMAGIRARCRKWLPEFYRSRYFILIYYGTGLETPGVTTSSILAGLKEGGAGPVREAAFVGLICKMEPMERGAKLAWIGQMDRDTNDSLLRKVLRTWERRVREGYKAP